MFDEEASPEKSENEEEEGEAELGYYGEGFVPEDIEEGKEFSGETEEEELVESGEFGEDKKYFLYERSSEAEYPSIWEGREGSSEAGLFELEETEEEKERRRQREELIELIREKLFDRLLIKRRNSFLQKKLTEHFRKRKMDNVFKVKPNTPDLEKKYLNRLYAFQEFKKAQENEMEELTLSMERYEKDTAILEKDLEEKLKHFITRAKEVSLNLILSKTGKKLNDKIVDNLLRRQVKKNEEKGVEKLEYIQIKNLIEEKESQIKALEYFGDGLHLDEYEQLKIDNQNFIHKIEEKDDELTKLRLVTEEVIQGLAHVKEKSYALESDIELLKDEFYEVEKTFSETRKRLTEKRIKRDLIRENCTCLKASSGLLTKNDLLMDFERSIYEMKILSKEMEKTKKFLQDKKGVEERKRIFLCVSLTAAPPFGFYEKVNRSTFHKAYKRLNNKRACFKVHQLFYRYKFALEFIRFVHVLRVQFIL